MIKSILKIIVFISIITLILSFGSFNLNFTPLLNGFNNVLNSGIVNLLKTIITSIFGSQYIMLFISVFIIMFVFFKIV